MSREIIYTLHVYTKHVVHNSIQPATHIIGHDKCLRRQQATLPQGLEDPGCCNWIRLTGKQSINMTLTVAGDAARRSAIKKTPGGRACENQHVSRENKYD